MPLHPAVMTDLKMPEHLKGQPGWNQGAWALTIRLIMHTSIMAWDPDEYCVDVFHALNVAEGLMLGPKPSLLEILRDTALSETLSAGSLADH